MIRALLTTPGCKILRSVGRVPGGLPKLVLGRITLCLLLAHITSHTSALSGLAATNTCITATGAGSLLGPNEWPFIRALPILLLPQFRQPLRFIVDVQQALSALLVEAPDFLAGRGSERFFKIGGERILGL